MKLPKSWTKVTPLSKTVALLLFISLPIWGFFLGIQYQSASDGSPVMSTLDIMELSDGEVALQDQAYLTNDDMLFGMISHVSAYDKSQPTLNFKCFDQATLPTDQRVSVLREELRDHNRAINTICTNTSNKEMLLITEDSTKGVSNLDARVELLDFYEPSLYNSKILFQETDPQKMRKVELVDWSTSGAIVFSLQDNSLGRQLSQTIRTYLYDWQGDSSSSPRLIEYCDVGIAGGTSAREIRKCIRFMESDTSLFFNQAELL